MYSSKIIRVYSSNDRDSLMTIMRLNVPDYFAESEIADFEYYLTHEIDQYFVIELNGELIGGGGINIDQAGKKAKISWDLLHPDFQNQGFGRELLQYRLNLLNEMKDLERISVRTSQLAYPFYEKNGFVLKEIIKDFWAKGFDLYDMDYQKVK